MQRHVHEGASEMSRQQQSKTRRSGFTLVELAVVIVIICVLAAFGVPRFLQSVERSKAAEAFAYLSSVRSAQERYQARQGTYTVTFTQDGFDPASTITQSPADVVNPMGS